MKREKRIVPEQTAIMELSMRKREKFCWFLFLIALSLIVSLPLFTALFSRGIINGDDALTHMQRIEGMLHSIQNAVIPPRIHLSTLQNYGYGAGFFYPQFFLLLPVLLRAVGLNFIITTNLSMMILNFVSGFSAFYAVRRISHSSLGAALSAILFSFASYRVADLYYRSTAGESIAFVFVPVLVLGFYEVFNKRPESWPWITLGLSGLVLSHNLSAILSGFVILIFLLLRIRRICTDKLLFAALIKALLSALSLSAFFWLPMLEQLFSGEIMITNSPEYPLRGPLPMRESFQVFRYWFKDAPNWLIDPLVCVFLLRVMAFFSPGRRRSKLVCADWLLMLGLGALLLSSDGFPWQQLPGLWAFIQFPWRLQFVSASLLSLAGGLLLGSFNSVKWQRLLVALVLFFSLFESLPIFQNALERGLIPSPGYEAIRNEIGVGENLPLGASVDFIEQNAGRLLSPDPALLTSNVQKKGLSLSFDFSGSENTRIELPFLWYKGWRFSVNGEPPKMAERGEHGLVLVNSGVHSGGSIHCYYQKTVLQHFSEFISWTALIGGVIFLFLKKKKKRIYIM